MTPPDSALASRPSSWADRLTRAIPAAGIPEAGAYAAAAVVSFVILTWSQWWAGSYPVGSFSLLHAVIALGIAAGPWMIAIFNRSAIRAMERVRPILGLDEAAWQDATTRLIRVPGLLDTLVAATWLALTALRLAMDPVQLPNLEVGGRGPGVAVGVVVLALFVLSISAYVVKVLHLAFGISQIARRELDVTLWELGPLHGFSNLTAQMAGSFIASIVVLYTVRSEALRDPFGLLAGVVGLAAAAGIFVIPLVGIHSRLTAEKARLRTEAARTMEAAVQGLHTAVAGGDLASMDAHYKAVSAAEVEMRAVAGIPTWPWLPDTFRWVVGALMFPIVLFLVQFVITKLLAA